MSVYVETNVNVMSVWSILLSRVGHRDMEAAVLSSRGGDGDVGCDAGSGVESVRDAVCLVFKGAELAGRTLHTQHRLHELITVHPLEQ